MSAISLLSAGLVLAMTALPAAAQQPLGAEHWNKRVALVFGSDTAKVESQLGDLRADDTALRERDMLLLRIEGEEARAAWGEPSGALDARALREAYRIAADTPFTVILVGKDGGEKLRRTEPVPARDMFALIDSMPMRQRGG